MLYKKVWDNWRENGKFISKNPDSWMDEEFLAAILWCIENKIQIFQNYSELYILWNQIKLFNTKCMLEIGCAYGGSLFMFSKALNKDARIIAIDLPNSQGGTADCQESFDKVISKLKNEGRDINVIIGDSQSKKIIRQYLELIIDHLPDFIFLDGGHSYEIVKDDFEIYGETLARGGFIALHDISDACESWIEVPRYWKELRLRFKKWDEITIQNCIGGIGVIYP